MSSRLPIGVATTNSVPGMRTKAFIVPLADRGGRRSADRSDISLLVGAMPVSEPLPHFVDDLLGYLHETHPTYATLDGVHTHDDLLEDLSRQGDRGRVRALSGYLRRLEEIDPEGLTPSSGSSTACSASPRARPHVRARGSAHLGEESRSSTPTSWRPASPAQALFTHAPGARTRPPGALEAAPDAASDSGRARQRQRPARHLRQGRHRDDARRAEVHRRRSAAGAFEPRRPAPARRSRRRADRGLARGRRVRRLPRDRDWRRGRARRSASAATSSSRSSGSRRASRCRSIGCSRSRRASSNATQEAFKSVAGRHERRRSAGDVGAHQGRPSRRRASSSTSAASSSTSCERSSSGSRSSRCRPASRSPSRRRPTSTAGRLPACGRRARSRASRRAPTTT